MQKYIMKKILCDISKPLQKNIKWHSILYCVDVPSVA